MTEMQEAYAKADIARLEDRLAFVLRVVARLENEIERLRVALEVTPERIERVAQIIAYELGYTWGSSALHHDEFREVARKALAKEEKE